MSGLPRGAVTRTAKLAALRPGSLAGPRWEPVSGWAAGQLSW